MLKTSLYIFLLLCVAGPVTAAVQVLIPDGCDPNLPAANDIKLLTAAFQYSTQTIRVEMLLCGPADSQTTYNLYLDYKMPFATDADRNGDGVVTRKDACFNTADSVMSRSAGQNAGPGTIAIDPADPAKLIFEVTLTQLPAPLVTPRFHFWATTRSQFQGHVSDRVPNTDGGNGCVEPETLPEMGLLTIGAAPTAPPCPSSGKLADYLALGSTGCLAGSRVFYNFRYMASGSGGAIAIPAEGVAVAPVTEGNAPGLEFTAPWSVGPGQTLDSLIEFEVTGFFGGQPISGFIASIEGYGATGGLVGVAQNTTAGGIFVYHSAVESLPSASLVIPPTMGPVLVTIDVSANGNNGFATVSKVSSRFSEPVNP